MTSCKHTTMVGLALLAFVFMAAPGFAKDFTRTANDNLDWFNTTAWLDGGGNPNLASEPGTTDTATIAANVITNRTQALVIAEQPVAGANYLKSLNISSGTLNINNTINYVALQLGYPTSATLTQTGGVINVAGGAVMGSRQGAYICDNGSLKVAKYFGIANDNPGPSTGVITMNNSTLTVGTAGQNFYSGIGWRGLGIMTLTNTTWNSFMDVYLGFISGSVGNLTMTGGALTAARLYAPYSGTGTGTLTNVNLTFTASRAANNGPLPLCAGPYASSGPGLLMFDGCTLANTGVASPIRGISAGEVGVGTIVLKGNTKAEDSAQVINICRAAGTGWTTGTLQVEDTASVICTTVAMCQGLGAGSLNVSGGSFRAKAIDSVTLDGIGSVNVSDGTLKVDDVMNMTGITGTYTGAGALNISGNGLVDVKTLSLLGVATSKGYVNLSGGTLKAETITRTAAPTTGEHRFTWTGGNLAVASYLLPELLNNSGTGQLMVGGENAIGTTNFNAAAPGGYSQDSNGKSVFDIDASNLSSYDQLTFTNNDPATFAGAIKINLLNGTIPAATPTTTFTIVTGSSITGSGVTFEWPAGAPAGQWTSVVSSDHIAVIYNSNMKPVANAGTNQTVTIAAGPAATLHGSGTDDGIPGTGLTYGWSSTGPAAVTYTPNANVPEPQVAFTQTGYYVFQLIVNDGLLDSDPSTVSVTVLNDTPVVDAGPDQTTTLPVTTVVLHGAASDFYPGALTTLWQTVPAGLGGVSILDDHALVTSVTLPSAGSYRFRLYADDGITSSSSDVFAQVIDSSNLPPTVNAGLDQIALLGAGNEVVVQLAGSVFEPEGQPTVTTWSAVLPLPAGGSVTFYNVNDVNTSATISGATGAYELSLVASDFTQQSVPDFVKVTVSKAASAVDAWIRY